jgi:2'-5' RNA ligase
VVGWVAEPNLHLTLRFLGTTPEARAETLAGALTDAVRDLSEVQLSLGGLGAFPSLARPRVLWIGVEMNVALAALYQKVDDLCDALGWGREARPFRPHVTVGRTRHGRRPPRVDAAHLTPEHWSTPVGSVDLMSSELAPGGARYRLVRAAPLTNEDDR